MCTEPPGLCHTRESDSQATSAQNKTWIYACAGMTNRVGERVLEMPPMFMLCRRAQAHGHFAVNQNFFMDQER